MVLVVSGCGQPALLAAGGGYSGAPLEAVVDHETETHLETGSAGRAGATTDYDRTTSRPSNLVVELSWPHPSAKLGTADKDGPLVSVEWTPRQGLPERRVRLHVDGTRGSRCQVDVVGGADHDQSFTLRVTFEPGACT